ncbi:DUF4402 domain-containing protein [Rosettibacter firmus]|uniref:DUF4402 domain-containing protein n=1 Tax=Rosettibacter firmus TaxID=3111522 RepID=UPI00336BB3F7
MKKLAKLLAILAFFFTVTTNYAQSASVQVSANILAALSIQHISGNLDFGNIVVTGSPQTPTKTPDNGALFEVTGNNNTPVTVTFNNVTLSNGGSGSMTFTPDVEHTTSSSYSGATPISSGNQVTLTSGGKAWLWVGGSLAVAADQEPGSYSGTFTISVAY